MYFCPCSCTKADCENEEDVLIYLPRNLSYAGESYLDRYSVSSAYVHNSKLEKQLLQTDADEHYLKTGAAACAEVRKELEEEEERGEGEREGEEESERDSLLGARAMSRPVTCNHDTVFRGGGPDNCDVDTTTTTTMTLPTPIPVSVSSPVPTPELTVTIDSDKSPEDGDMVAQSGFEEFLVKSAESPDSDLVSEEGIFVNMMDDLDGLGGGPGGKSTLSEASDDTYVSGDSMYYSPVEVEEMEDEQARGHLKESLEEAVLQAAFTFHPSPSVSSPPAHSPTDNDDDNAEAAACFSVENTVLSLSLPHANEGESEDGGCEGLERKEGGEEECSVEVGDSGSCSKASSVDNESTVDHTQAPQSPSCNKNNTPCALEIHLTDMSITTAQNEDKGPLSSSYRDLLSPDSPLYEDREFNFTRTELRKSTSLKSTKTPPGTPRRKKVVRFADAMGLDLESVRHVLNLESPPKIPPSAMKDLQPGLSEDRKAMGSRFITETFMQPGADPHFRERVMGEKVVLENALVVAGSITGVVRVANISFHKTVRVRFTTNGWASFHDIAASYMANSNDGPTDRFSFTLVPPPDFCPGARLEFAISYSTNGVDFWDNNYGNNYVFECYAKTVPTEAENAWMHFL